MNETKPIENDTLTPTEACAYLSISRSALARLVKAGDIPHRRLSARIVRFSRAALAEYCAGRSSSTPEAMARFLALGKQTK